jgi:hypothetical protein
MWRWLRGRERLGIGGSVAQGLVRLARELRGRPLLGTAVRSGEITVRQAQTVLPVAHGEEERGWVERARGSTVRQLEKAVREAGAEPAEAEPVEEGEPWERVDFELSAEGHTILDEALALAGTLLGAAAPVWDRLEVICQEYLGAHPAPEPEPGKRPEDQLFLSLCAGHHLHGVHRGYIRVKSEAPGALAWSFPGVVG